MISLYKQDSKGKLRVWNIYTEGSKLIEESGLLDGKLVINSKTCKGKNIGKSNETTPEEQAILEMNSKAKKKLDSGYYEDLKEAKNNKLLLPMLAKSADDIEVTFPCWAQPKLDGMRALGADKLISRKGKEIDTLEHVTKDVVKTEFVLDGELYAHGLSFQENMKLIKKYRPNQSEDVKYHVYDLVDENLPFPERYQKLEAIVEELNSFNIYLVPTKVIHSEEELADFHHNNVTAGYEGTMIRFGNEGYKIDGRSKELLKYKDFIDGTYKVVDIVPMDARPEQGVVVCDSKYGHFKATPKMSAHDKEKLLINKDQYIGQIAEVRYFEETDSGLPRFPVCVGFRLDK